MNEHTKYDPEDIEKLLRNKSFDELLDKERTFVNNHISSEEEYNQMRHLLIDLEDQEWEETPEPPKSLRIDLIAQHKKSNKKGFQIWLNSLFAADRNQLTWYQKPTFQLGIATILVVGSVLFFNQQDSLDQPLAEVRTIEKTKEYSPNSLNKLPKNESNKVIENESVTITIPDLVDDNIKKPTMEPVENLETENDLKSNLTLEDQNTDLFDEELNPEDVTSRRKDEKISSDDSEMIDNIAIGNTEAENKFGKDKDIASNVPKSDVSVIETFDAANETRTEDNDKLNDFEPKEDDYLEEVLEEEVALQEVIVNSTTKADRANESYADLNKKKEDLSPVLIFNSVSLKQQSDIIDQLFTAY